MLWTRTLIMNLSSHVPLTILSRHHSLIMVKTKLLFFQEVFLQLLYIHDRIICSCVGVCNL
jgi:hypothetical protein